MLRNIQLRNGVISFLFLFLVQAGIFFVVPLFLSVALGLSAVATGVRLLPLSLMLLLFAVGVPKLFPNASPRRVIRLGFMTLFAGLVLLVALLDYGAGAEIVTWPLLLAGAGIGSIASQLGSVTVSAVPDEQSGEVGGLQNTGIAARRVDRHRAGGRRAHLRADRVVPHRHRRTTRPFPTASPPRRRRTSPAASRSCPTPTSRPRSRTRTSPRGRADAIVDENEKSRIDGLRVAVSILALFALARSAVHPRHPDGATRRPNQAQPTTYIACRAGGGVCSVEREWRS